MFKVYQVLENDTLDKIANNFYTNIDTLKEMNGIDDICIGDMIVVPSNNWYDKYIVKNGDTLYSIAKENEISVNDLVKINGLNITDYIYPGEEIIVPKNGYMVYVTNENDTLKDILNMVNGKKLFDQGSNINLMKDQLIVYKK